MSKFIKLATLIMALFLAGFSLANNAKHVADKPKTTAVATTPAEVASAKVNINTASASDLEKVKGIGPKKAEAIVAYRGEHGKFQSVADLSKVKGIGDKLAQKISDQVIFD